MSKAPFDGNKMATTGDLYHPAMEVRTEDEAAAYLERLISWSVAHWGQTREYARSVHLQNIGYFSGYYDDESASRAMRLFNTRHPIFGKGRATTAQAMEAGVAAGRATR